MNCNRFPKKIALLCLLLAGILTGCGAKTSSPSSDTPDMPTSAFNDEDTALIDEDTVSTAGGTASFELPEKTITVPSLTKEYTFLYFSDTHMIKLNGTESEQITENALPRMQLFTDAEGISSADRFPEWIDYANEKETDMVLFGGDIIDFPSDTNLALLKENISRLEMPYVYTLGNHDWTYPWDYMTAEGRVAYRPLFDEFTKNNPTASITEYEELVILSVDNSSNQLDPEALTVVDEALALKKPVIVIAHVPFSTDSVLEKTKSMWNSPVSIGMADKGGIFPDANTLAFQEKILAEDSPVICVLSGHVHFADTSMLNDNVTQIIAGAGYNGEGILLHLVPSDSAAENEN